MRERLGARLHDPVFWNDVVQVLKTARAAILAWVLASSVFGQPQPFLAPWAALLVVHATVGQLLGLDTWAVAVVVVVGLFLGLLFSRLIDTATGVVVGLVVNFLVWPPVRRRTTIAAMDRIDDAIGDLLSDMASTLSSGCDSDDIGEWIERTRDLDGAPAPGAEDRAADCSTTDEDTHFAASWTHSIGVSEQRESGGPQPREAACPSTVRSSRATSTPRSARQ
jgi:uncharacterized membrane protein YgaE (UPF0421/DUF939 family)